MVLGLLAFLLALDFFIAYAMFRLSRKQSEHHLILKEMSEERSLLTDLRQSIRDELSAAQNQVRSMKQQVQVLATEAEQEVQNGVTQITSATGDIIAELSTRFDTPMEQLNEKQHYIEHLIQRLQTERKQLIKTIEKAQALAQVFRDGVRAEDILEEIEDKKYTDVQKLLAKGLPSKQVATQLGLPEQEVRVIASIRP
jgi:type I site-specific restriction-modification system R (restriction) subunit